MPDLPQGTVTFAFTDIEGSTVLLKRLDDGYADVLAAHRKLVRETFTERGGIEIDTQGDAFFFAFVRARDAVAAAAAVQRAHAAHPWPHGGEVRMRVGLHTGEPTLGEEGYLGLDVVRAARLCGLCQGGQVLLSETTRALVGSKPPPGVSLFPLGERHLKDIDEPEQVYELEIEGVEHVPAQDARGLQPAEVPDGDSLSEGKTRGTRWEDEFEQRLEGLLKRTTEGILDRTLGEASAGSAPNGADEGGVDDLAARADEMAMRIEREILRALSDEPDARGQ